MPPFRDVLVAISNLYRDERGSAATSAARLLRRSEPRARCGPRPTRSPRPSCQRRRGHSVACSTRSGEASEARRSSRPARPSSSCRMHLHATSRPCPCHEDARRDGRRGMYDLLAAVHRSPSTGSGSSRTSRDAVRQRPARCDLLHGWVVTGEERYRRVARRPSTTSSGARPPGGRLASAQDADTDGVEGLTFTWTRRGVPDELLQPFEDGLFRDPGRARRGAAARLWRSASSGPSPRATTMRCLLNGLAPPPGGAGTAPRRPNSWRRPSGSPVPPGSLSTERAASTAPTRRPREEHRLPRDYADVANGPTSCTSRP